MTFLVDADVMSAHLRGRGKVTSRLMQHTGRLAMSVVTLAELQAWLYRDKTPQRYRDGLTVLKGELLLLPIDENVANRFGELASHFLDRGQPIATPDLLIASTALVHDLTLVTGNVRHFSAVDGLRIENWLEP